ncbi:hypothetical protein C9I89_06775 [Photobacterium lipolyticum]|uniref:Uncharacterized protein n=1 Tax=Photobacterium lipolyticum TaxID=266810 RepID=A0A2T3N1U9_9GAMM|nr:hypothetical protein C9I89_06775 [Photobacterium lipolyticum]
MSHCTSIDAVFYHHDTILLRENPDIRAIEPKSIRLLCCPLKIFCQQIGLFIHFPIIITLQGTKFIWLDHLMLLLMYNRSQCND